MKEKKWKRNCPECNNIILYTVKWSRDNAENNSRKCRKCCMFGIKKPNQSKRMTGSTNPMYGKDGYWFGKKNPKQSERMLGDKNPSKRIDVREKISKSLIGRALTDEWKCNISKNHADFSGKNSARYGGIGNYEMWKLRYGKVEADKRMNDWYYKTYGMTKIERVKLLPKKQSYYYKVWSETKKQPIHILEGYQNRGRAGIEGAYHLDHIQSIIYGFENDISSEDIGNINNLRFIPWEENIKKGKECE